MYKYMYRGSYPLRPGPGHQKRVNYLSWFGVVLLVVFLSCFFFAALIGVCSVAKGQIRKEEKGSTAPGKWAKKERKKT
jgi:CBS domain containing-hemolysin-like protein